MKGKERKRKEKEKEIRKEREKERKKGRKKEKKRKQDFHFCSFLGQSILFRNLKPCFSYIEWAMSEICSVTNEGDNKMAKLIHRGFK